MNKEEFLHAYNKLKEKKKEFEQEIIFIKDEIKILREKYIKENAKFKIGDIVKYIPELVAIQEKREYKIKNIYIKDKFFDYDCISLGNNFHRIGSFAVHEKDLLLKK